MDRRRTAGVDGAVVGVRASCRVIADRYDEIEELGRGGSAVVYVCTDKRTGELVVVKEPSDASDRTRRIEITALGRSRVPGVVSLRDIVERGGQVWFVMDYIDGAHFPGRIHTRRSWSLLKGRVLSLAQILAHLHARGIIHCDLKPANILVTENAEVWLLDLGIARGGGVLTGAGGLTWNYASPEQRRGEKLDATADVFAFGVMVWEVLTGRRPDVDHPDFALRGPRSGMPRDVPPSVVELLKQTLAWDRTQRPRSAVEVLEVLHGGCLPHVDFLRGSLPPVASREQLAALFPPDDEFVRLGRDFSLCLTQRTRGERESVIAELDSMFRSGLVWWTGSTFGTDRVSVDRICAGARIRPSVGTDAVLGEDAALLLGWARELAPLVNLASLKAAAELPTVRFNNAWSELSQKSLVWLVSPRFGASAPTEDGGEQMEDGGEQVVCTAIAQDWSDQVPHPEPRAVIRALPPLSARRIQMEAAWGPVDARLVEQVCRWTHSLIEAGRPLSAMPVLEEQLRIVRANKAPDLEIALCEALGAATLSAETEPAYEAALMVLLAHEAEEPRLTAVAGLMNAAWALMKNRIEIAKDLLGRMGEFEDPRLEVWRMALQHRCIRFGKVADEERWFDETQSRAESRAEWHGKWLGWKGLLRYRQERFDDAAEFHRQAYALKRGHAERLSSQHNYAQALLEGGRFAEAYLAADGLEKAADRNGLYRLLVGAVYLKQSVAWRSRQPVEECRAHFEVSRVDAVARVDLTIAAQFAILEAAWWWAEGDDRERALQLARHGEALARRAGAPLHLSLLGALAFYLEGRPDGEQAEALYNRIPIVCPPGVRLQAVALLAALHPRPEWWEKVNAWSDEIDPDRWTRRAEVMSVQEARALVGLDPPAAEDGPRLSS